jgi:1,4-alpha-glucan branching enzyme
VIHCEPTKRGDQVKVTFTVPADDADGSVAVVGDFNGWNPGANPMRRKGDVRTACLTLSAGRTYAFRYVTETGAWLNDAAAHGYEPNHLGGENSVLDLRDAGQLGAQAADRPPTDTPRSTANPPAASNGDNHPAKPTRQVR